MRHQLYSERQQKLLCGLHALNHLVQRNVFTERYLNIIAEQCKLEEIAELGFDTGYEFCTQYGYYDYAVLKKALQHLKIDMVDIRSKTDPRARAAVSKTAHQDAFIVQREDHWYTLRKFNGTWYEFNSSPQQIVKHEVSGDHIKLFDTEDKRRSFGAIYAIMKMDN